MVFYNFCISVSETNIVAEQKQAQLIRAVEWEVSTFDSDSGNFNYPTPAPTPGRLRPSAVLVT